MNETTLIALAKRRSARWQERVDAVHKLWIANGHHQKLVCRLTRMSPSTVSIMLTVAEAVEREPRLRKMYSFYKAYEEIRRRRAEALKGVL